MFQVGPVGDRLRKYPDISTVHLFSNTDVALIISGVRRNLASKVTEIPRVRGPRRGTANAGLVSLVLLPSGPLCSFSLSRKVPANAHSDCATSLGAWPSCEPPPVYGHFISLARTLDRFVTTSDCSAGLSGKRQRTFSM